MSQKNGVKKCGKWCECGEPATWVYHETGMQIPFCEEHAKKDELFGIGDSSDSYWQEIPKHNQETDRATSVRGYNRPLVVLAVGIHRLRYDAVEQFYCDTETELKRQAEANQAKGHLMLAVMLEEAALTAQKQQDQFAKIRLICKDKREMRFK